MTDTTVPVTQARAIVMEHGDLPPDAVKAGLFDTSPIMRAVIAALAAEQSRASTPAVDREALRNVMARLPTRPWRVRPSILADFGGSLEVDNEGHFGNIAHVRHYDSAAALADLARLADAILALHPPVMGEVPDLLALATAIDPELEGFDFRRPFAPESRAGKAVMAAERVLATLSTEQVR